MKDHLHDFALLGGRPTFVEPLHVGRPNVGDGRRLHQRIQGMLDRRWFTNDGPLVREFEARVAETLGVRHCVAVSSGTRALEILVRAAALEGEIIVPSFTFIGTAHAMTWCGLTPRFCDVDPATHTLDPVRVRELIGPRTAAILGVHLWGRPCHMEALATLAAENDIRLFYDAAHAFACSHGGLMLGNFGDAEVLSFHATKVVHSFEGGAITTHDGELAERARLMRNFGFRDYDDVGALGTNGKLNEAAAAMGLTSLDDLEDILACNRRNHDQYRDELSGLPGVSLVDSDEEHWNRQYVVLEIDGAETGLARDELRDLLWAEGVLARRYFYPGCHAMEPYRTLDPEARRTLPATEELARRVLCLPTGNAVGPVEIGKVCAIVRAALAHGPELQRRLAARSSATVG
jgi:dTDP-4-amino-4,6-dideoxygalactose transaminase